MCVVIKGYTVDQNMLSCMSLQALEVNERLNCVVEPYMEAQVRVLPRMYAICTGMHRRMYQPNFTLYTYS